MFKPLYVWHFPMGFCPRILDAGSMTFSSGPTMAVGRSGCAVAALDERRVLVAGGFDGCRRCLEKTGCSHEICKNSGVGCIFHHFSQKVMLIYNDLYINVDMLFGNYSVSDSDFLIAVFQFLLRIVENARSLDSTELVDPVTLKVIAGPRMGTRRRLDRKVGESRGSCSWSSWSYFQSFPTVMKDGLRVMNDEEKILCCYWFDLMTG